MRFKMAKSQLKAGVYLSYLSLFVTNISNLILTPFIIRNLGDSQYGLYMLIGALVGYIAVLDFGLGNTTVRYVAKYRTEKDKAGEENFLFSTLVIYIVISVLVLLIGTILYNFLDLIFEGSLTASELPIAKVMFIILIINLAITLPMKLFTGIMNAYEKFVILRALNIGRLIIRMILIFIFLFLGYKAIAIVLIDAILNVFMIAFSMFFVFVKLKVKIKPHNFSISIYKEIFSYSSLIFISVIVDQIYWRIGHLILGVVASTTEVAVFAIGIMFGQYFITFATAISGVFLPKVTGMVINKSTGEELTDLFIKTGRLQFLVLGLILGGFITLGKTFVLLWAGPGYGESWIIALIVMIPLMIVLTQTIGRTVLQAKNLHGFRALIYLIIAVINTFTSIYLAKNYGSVGAATGTSLSLILGNIIAINFVYHFKAGLNIPRFFKEMYHKLLVTFILTLIIGILLSIVLSNDTWIMFVVNGLL